MKWFLNMRMRSKIIALVVLLLGAAVCIGVFALTRLEAVKADATALATNWLPKTKYLEHLKGHASDLRQHVLQHAISTTEAEFKEYEEMIQNDRSGFETDYKHVGSLLVTDEGKQIHATVGEVRKLAERSSSETKAIAELVSRVKLATEKAVGAIDSGLKEVETGSALSEEAGNTLAQISSNAEEGGKLIARLIESARSLAEASARVEKAIDEIVSVAEENTAATEEMAASAEEVEKAVDAIASVSEETAATVEEVSASAEQVSASIQQMAASAESLADMVQKLRDAVNRFKV